jgi:hypothetical protein
MDRSQAPAILALWRLRQEDLHFEASLGLQYPYPFSKGGRGGGRRRRRRGEKGNSVEGKGEKRTGRVRREKK